MATDRGRWLSELRRSGAAGPHGPKSRDRANTEREAIEQELADQDGPWLTVDAAPGTLYPAPGLRELVDDGRMTRAEQFNILYPIALAYQTVAMELGEFPDSADGHGVSSFRAALRLDDKSLDLAIAFGAHKLPWESEVVK